MPRNASHATRQREPARVPAWVWLFTGSILGAFVMFLLHLSEIPQQEGTSAKTNNKQEEDTSQKPRFDFYDLLKETEIPVLKEAPSPEERATAETKKPEYIIQVASFKSEDDADRLRAELVLLNLDAHTKKAKIRDGDVRYRVLVGPFTSKSKLSKARSTLLSNRYEALTLKHKKD